MREMTRIGWILAVLLIAAWVAAPQMAAQDQRNSLVIIFNDGHQQTFPLADARIAFKGSNMIVSTGGHSQSFPLADIAHVEFGTEAPSTLGRGRFLGKWGVGDGAGMNFYIPLSRNGEAYKSMDSGTRGTWAVVDGEARITWEDGWRDVIRKAGSKFEKVAFEPGKSFDDTPSNIADAENTDPEPI